MEFAIMYCIVINKEDPKRWCCKKLIQHVMVPEAEFRDIQENDIISQFNRIIQDAHLYDKAKKSNLVVLHFY